MTETGKLEISYSLYALRLLFFVMFVALSATLIISPLVTAELDTVEAICPLLLGILFGVFSVFAFFSLFEKTVTKFDEGTATVEVRKYSFRHRNPEPDVVPWVEINDVLVVPGVWGGNHYAVWLLLFDGSLVCLNWFEKEWKARELRDRVASFLGLSGPTGTQAPDLKSGAGA